MKFGKTITRRASTERSTGLPLGKRGQTGRKAIDGDG